MKVGGTPGVGDADGEAVRTIVLDCNSVGMLQDLFRFAWSVWTLSSGSVPSFAYITRSLLLSGAKVAASSPDISLN